MESIKVFIILLSFSTLISSASFAKANGPIMDRTSAEQVCSDSPDSPLSKAIINQPGSVLEIFCEISFNYLPLFEGDLSIFEQSSRDEFAQSIAISIVSLEVTDFNSVVLLLLESYKLGGTPGLPELIQYIESFAGPQLEAQREHSASVEFLDSTMVWGTTFLFAYRGIPWMAQKIGSHPRFPWKNLKISIKRPTPTAKTSATKGSGNSSLVSTVPTGRELMGYIITELPKKSPSWYHYYMAGAGIASIEGLRSALSIKMVDVSYLRDSIDVDVLCEVSVLIAEMSEGLLPLNQNQIAIAKQKLSRFKDSGQNKFANYFPEQQLKPIGNMRYSERAIWDQIYNYYPSHTEQCRQLSAPLTASMLQTLEKAFQPPEVTVDE